MKTRSQRRNQQEGIWRKQLIIGVHRESFIPFKWIARSDGMTEKMIIVQIGTEQHYSLWTDNRSMCKLWMLRRIKELGGNREDLLLVYILQIRGINRGHSL